MGLIDFPDVVGMFEGAKTAGLEREIANAIVSASFSGYITGLWSTGKAASSWKLFSSEGPAMQAMATSVYLSLSELEKKGFLTLTVPKDLLDPGNLSKFQTEWRNK